MTALWVAWNALPAWIKYTVYGMLLGIFLGGYGVHFVHRKIDMAQRALADGVVERLEKKVDKATDKVEAKVAQDELQAKDKERVIYREVIKYVPQNDPPTCPNIDIGSVRMLNAARTARSSEDVMQATATLTDEEATTPSTITRRDLIVSDIQIALMYNDLAREHNALIDFIEEQQKALGNMK